MCKNAFSLIFYTNHCKIISKILQINIIKLYYLVVSQNRRELCLTQQYRPSQYNNWISILKDLLEIYIANRLYPKESSNENKKILIWSRSYNIGISFGKTGYWILSKPCWINRQLLADKILWDVWSVGWRAKAIACPKLCKSLFIGFKTDRVETINDGKSL